MSNEKSLVKSIFSFSISSWVNIVMGFLYTILSTRLLSPDVYGMVSIFMSSSNTLMYVICLGLDASLIRFYNERPNNETQQQYQTKTIFLVTINFSIVFLIATIFNFEWFNQFMFGRLSWYLSIMLFISAYSHLLLRFFNISYRMSFNVKRYTVQNILIQSGTKIFTLSAALFRPTYEVVVLFQVSGIVLIAVTYLILQKNEIFTNDIVIKGQRIFKGYSSVIKFAIFSAPLYISANLNVLLSQNIIKNNLGAAQLGVYASVSIFGTLFGAVSTGFSTFWSAYVYKNYDNEKNKIEMMSNFIVIMAFLALSSFVLFKDIFYIFIGTKYKEGIYFFSIVLMTNVIDLLSQATYYGIDIAKKNYITAITNCCYVALNALCAYLGSLKWGIIGAAIYMMGAKLLLFLINTCISQKYYKSINSYLKFSLGIILTVGVAILPSFKFNFLVISAIVLLMFNLSCLIYNMEYNQMITWIKYNILKNRKFI